MLVAPIARLARGDVGRADASIAAQIANPANPLKPLTKTMNLVSKHECGVARTGLALAVAALLSSPAVWASGYNFGTQSASGQGSAHANGAEANDASVIYANPAGLTRLKGFQGTQVLNVVLPSVEFNQTAPATARFGASSVPITGNNGGDPVDTTVVPHGYLSYQLDDRFTAGLGVYVPFGANVSYDHQFVGR